jgi:ribonuclease VapC
MKWFTAMIVVDSSALIAILDREPDAALYAEAIAEADSPLISAATLLELHIVMLNCTLEKPRRSLTG